MSTFLGLLPFVFGAVAIVVHARAKRPVVLSLGLTVSRRSPLVVIGRAGTRAPTACVTVGSTG